MTETISFTVQKSYDWNSESYTPKSLITDKS